MTEDPYRPPLSAEGPEISEGPGASGGPALTVIGLFEVISGALGMLILSIGLGEQLRFISLAWSTDHGWMALANTVIFVAFLSFFSLCMASGVSVLRRQPGRLSRFVPLILALQCPVLIIPEVQFFAALVPPQVGFQIFGDGNIRFGVHFALTTAFKLAFEDTPVPGAVMLNVVPAALLAWATRRARDSVLFSPRREER